MALTEAQRRTYREQFRSHFHEEFQSWIEKLARALHEPGDFQHIRKTSGDGGLDGFVISTGQVYQVYAPARISEHRDGDIAAKIRDDFRRVYSTLNGNLRAWSFVHNYPEDAIGQLTATAIAELSTSHPEITFKILGIDSFWDLLAGSMSDESMNALFPREAAVPDRYLQESHTERASRELSRIQRLRGVASDEMRAEVARLANRVSDGDLQHAAPGFHAEVLYWAARLHASAATLEQARAFRQRLALFALPPGTPVLDALILEASGDPEGALRALRELDDPDVRCATLAVLCRSRGRDASLAWFDGQPDRERPDYLTAYGWRNLAVSLAEVGRWADALAWLARVHHLWDDCPDLPILEGRARVAFLLAPELRRHALGAVIYFRGVMTLEGAEPDRHRAAARACFERAQELWRDLHPPLALEARNWSRWLLLTHPDPEMSAAAREELKQSMSDGESIIRFLPLARAHDIPFDADKAQLYLARRSQLGGLDDDERCAEFTLNQLTLEPRDLLAYLEREETGLGKVLQAEILASARIEALVKDGQVIRARAVFQETRGVFDEDSARRVEVLIAQSEGEDPRRRLEDNLSRTGSLIDLTNLIGYLRAVRDWAALRPLLAELVRQLPTRDNARQLVACMMRSGQATPGEILTFLEANPDLVDRAPDLQSAKAWALFRNGRLEEAVQLNRQLLAQRSDDADLDLDINLALAAGQWERFSAIVDREWPRRHQHPSGTLMRLASIAAQVDVAAERAWEMAKLAVQRNARDPHLLMSALWLRYRLGHDDDQETASWLRQALDLSSEAGPLHVMDLPTVVRDWMPAQRDNQRSAEEAWLRGEIPLHVAASLLNVPLSHLLVSAPRMNLETQDGRGRMLLPIVSERHQPQPIQPDWTVGLDVTTLFVLAHLRLLDKVLASLSKVCIASETLVLILNEQNQVRHHQPARVRAAEALREILDRHQLRDAELPVGDIQVLSAEVGHDLAQMLEAARTSGGTVVRPLPIYRPASLMQEPAVLGEHERLICSTADLELALFRRGLLDDALHDQAHRYLLTQDRPANAAPDDSLLSRPLYLDDLAVTFLQHARLLPAMVAANLDLRVHPSLRDDTNRLIESARQGERLAATLDQIRTALRGGIEDGKIQILPRRDAVGGQQLPGAAAPTLMQFLDYNGPCDAICIDDRFINRHAGLQDRQGRTVPALCVLDLLRFLAEQGSLSASDQAATLHLLRQSGFIFLPVTPAELVALAATARSSETGNFLESVELRALRQSLARVREIPPLHKPAKLALAETLLAASVLAIRQLWQDPLLAADRALYITSWIWLHVAPSPDDWLHDAHSSADEATAALAWHIWPLLQPLLPMNEHRHGFYLDWLERQVLRPLLTVHPGVLDRLGRQAGELIERWASEPMENVPQFAHYLFDSQPPAIRAWLAGNFTFRAELRLSFERSLGLSGVATILPRDFFSATRSLVATREPQTLLTTEGRPAMLTFHDDVPVLELAGEDGEPCRIVLHLLEVGVFSDDRDTRLSALDKVLLRLTPPPSPAIAALRQAAELRLLSDDEIHQLFDALEYALLPHEDQLREAFANGRWPPEQLAPSSFAYFERFCGPDPGATNPETYITRTLPQHRQDLLRCDLGQGLRICLLGALRDDLYPGGWLESFCDDKVWDALQACHPEAEPLSLLAALDVALHRAHDARFVAFAERAVEALLEDSFPLPCGHDFYAVFAPLAELVLEQVTFLEGGAERAPFWRRLCAWMEAALIAPLLPPGAVDLESLARGVSARLSLAGQWAKLVDLRREPLAHPSPLEAPFVRAEILGRLWRLTQSHQAAGRQVPRAVAIDAARNSRPFMLKPEPLAAHLSPATDLPPEVAAQLAGAPIADLSVAVVLYARLYRLPAELRALLGTSLTDRDGRDLRKQREYLENTALVAAAQRDQNLADAVANAALAMAPRLKTPGEVGSLLHVLLIAGAAREDETAWAAWLEDRFAGLAGGVPSGEAARMCWHFLQRIGRVTKMQLRITHRAAASASAAMS